MRAKLGTDTTGPRQRPPVCTQTQGLEPAERLRLTWSQPAQRRLWLPKAGQESLAPDRRTCRSPPVGPPDIRPTDQAMSRAAGEAPEAMDGGRLDEARVTWRREASDPRHLHPGRDLQGDELQI